MMILLLFLQKQNLASAIYLFRLGTRLSGPGLKHMPLISTYYAIHGPSISPTRVSSSRGPCQVPATRPSGPTSRSNSPGYPRRGVFPHVGDYPTLTYRASPHRHVKYPRTPHLLGGGTLGLGLSRGVYVCLGQVLLWSFGTVIPLERCRFLGALYLRTAALTSSVAVYEASITGYFHELAKVYGARRRHVTVLRSLV